MSSSRDSGWFKFIIRSVSLCAFCGAGVFFLIVSSVSSVKAASSSTPVIPNDPSWSKQWYLRQINAPEAWAVTRGSRNVIVAVIDGGVDVTHPDLRDNIWVNDKEIPGDGIDNDGDGYVDDVQGWNFVTKSPDVRPVFRQVQMEEAWSHGTMIASLIGAKGDNEIGMAGVAWNVRLMPLVVLDADGAGTTANIARAIRYAVSHGAGVINLSLVGYDYDESLDQLIRNAADAGVVVVAATGNDDESKAGINLDDIPAYPVCSDSGRNAVLGVGGTDTLDQKAPYANFGKACTDLSAPAQSMFAARPSFSHGLSTRPLAAVPQYAEDVTGTSLAAPLVAGVAALIKSVRPTWTVAQIQDRIISTVDQIESGVDSQHNGWFGSGRLNAGRALAGLEPPPIVSQPLIPEVVVPNFITHTQAEATSTTFIIQNETGGERRWSVSGRVEQSGWLDREDGKAPLAYAWVRSSQRYRLYAWDPDLRKTRSSRPLLRGLGPWTVAQIQFDGDTPTFIFTSKVSHWATQWDGWTGQGKTMSRKALSL